MTMSRQHFQLIADVLKSERSECRTEQDIAIVEDLAESFACELARTNPRFNRTRFLKACGLEQPEVR